MSATAAQPSYIPTREELVREARKLVPALRERAQATDELRTLPAETVADLKAAGIHKIFTPRRYGGFEMDWGAHVDVSRELGRGCGSTSWVSSVVMSHTWMLGRFPVRAQEEFWPSHPDAIIATAFTGSKDLLVKDVFVPEYRTVLSEELAGAEPPGAKLHNSYIYRTELGQLFYTLLCGPMLGATRGGLEHYLEQTRERTGQMFGESVVEQVPVQIRVAESYEELRVADLITDKLMQFLHEAGRSGKRIRGINRLRIRREPAMAAKLCLSAITRLANMMGVTGQTGNNPVQRHYRDVRTISTHGGLNWDNGMMPTGKLLLGVPTGDPLTDMALNKS